MTFFAAAAWSFGARLGLDTLILSILALQPRARLDAVTLVLCQAAAFVGALFLLLHFHNRERPLTDALALRPTLISLCLVAAVLGVTLHAPFDRLADLIAQRFPPSAEETAAQAEAFAAADLLHRSAIVFAAGFIAPLVEEIFFRGGLFGGMRRGHTTTLVVFSTALLFACSHLSMRNLVPVFAIGLILGRARASSGSLWPGLILHIVFNTTSIVDSFSDAPSTHHAAVLTSLPVSLAGLLASLALLWAFHALAHGNARCAAARTRDLS
jgi:membrane protease YdiL (CAAX protease family)